jgi:trk system potassium uptake protein TrkA
VTGFAFDWDALAAAGIERADGLAAMTASDEANIVTARLARTVHQVPRVVARIYDPRAAEIYRRLGVQTISTTAWGIARTAELLCYSELDTLCSVGGDGLEIAEAEVPPFLVGRSARELTIVGQTHVIAVRRAGRAFLAAPETVFEAGDRAVLAVASAALDRVHALLGRG